MRNWDVSCPFLYGEKGQSVLVESLAVPKQTSRGSNCAFLAALFAVFVCCGQDYIGYPFPPELDQRTWFFNTVKGGEIILPLLAAGEASVITKAKSEVIKTNYI